MHHFSRGCTPECCYAILILRVLGRRELFDEARSLWAHKCSVLSHSAPVAWGEGVARTGNALVECRSGKTVGAPRTGHLPSLQERNAHRLLRCVFGDREPSRCASQQHENSEDRVRGEESLLHAVATERIVVRTMFAASRAIGMPHPG